MGTGVCPFGTSHNVLPLFFQGNGNNKNYSFCNKDYYYWNNNDIDCKSVYLIKTLLFICNLLTKKLNENLTCFFWLSNPGSLPLTLCKLLLPPKGVHVHFGNFTVWDYNFVLFADSSTRSCKKKLWVWSWG